MVLDTIINNMISNFFGEVWIFGIAIILFFIIAVVSMGVNFSSAVILSLPISMAVATSGFLAGYGWIADAILVIIGLTYGFIIIRLISRG